MLSLLDVGTLREEIMDRTRCRTLEAADGIFAGGDVVSGAASVIKAIEAGKRAARSINAYITKH
jgi:NADPH-dependent glutamate synthase beta subunit-like oxidoreductase